GAITLIIFTGDSRRGGEEREKACRPHGLSTVPSAVTGSSSGCWWVSHGGGEAVAVASATLIPASSCRSIISSSQAKSYSPSRGSSVDRKSTRLNSSHVSISYAVFCLKNKNI